MAEATFLRNNALPYPIYGAPFTIVFPLLDADGDPISPSSPDAEISKNGDTFTDCTNESTEIATSSGVCYLSLTATELTTDVAAIQAKSTGAKTTVAVLYPRKLVTIRSGTSASAGSSTSTIVLDASASAIDDFYNGMVCIATIDSNVEVRVITDYVGSTQTATVVPDWNVAPDNNDTFVIKLPEGVQVNQANVTNIANDAITAAAIAANAIGASEIADGAIDSGAFATGAITTATFAAGAINDAAVAADVTIASVTGAVGSVTGAVGSVTGLTVALIADGVWDEVLSGHLGAGSAGEALDAAGSAGDPWSVVLPGAYVGNEAGALLDNVEAIAQSLTARVPAALNADGYIQATAQAINDSETASERLEQSVRCNLLGVVGVGSGLFSVVAASLDPASTADTQWNGLVIAFVNDTATASLQCQGNRITGFDHATQTFTVEFQWTEAPQAGDVFTVK